MSHAADTIDEQVVASPCINICKMNAATGLCEGCQRSIDEIASWSAYSAAQKRAVLALLPTRKQTL
jgi:uncharacterized protein